VVDGAVQELMERDFSQMKIDKLVLRRVIRRKHITVNAFDPTPTLRPRVRDQGEKKSEGMFRGWEKSEYH
jgi:hypothetical protein